MKCITYIYKLHYSNYINDMFSLSSIRYNTLCYTAFIFYFYFSLFFLIKLCNKEQQKLSLPHNQKLSCDYTETNI